jgi:hypothetical protein
MSDVSATPLHAYDLSAGLFIRGLTNMKGQLTKAEAHAAAIGAGEAALLAARLGDAGGGGAASSYAPADVHGYTLAAQVHWAAEGARLAIAHLLGTPRPPEPADAKTFADLHRRLETTLADFSKLAPGDLEAGLARTIVIAHRGGATSASGGEFLTALAIPHFYYHATAVYGILRNAGVPLTMGDFLGNWGARQA